jgi:hypothetical protein
MNNHRKIFWETQQQIQPNKLLAPPNQVQWSRFGRAFICTLMGLNLEPFFWGPRVLERGYTIEPSPFKLGEVLSMVKISLMHVVYGYMKK